MPPPIETIDCQKSPTVGPFFLDSGAHSLYMEHVMGSGSPDYFKTKGFRKYVDKYAAFVKQHPEIKYYANVDVVYDPKLTWKTQRYLEEEHGLNPIPVLHHGAGPEWLDRYLKRGYDPIALGGFGQYAIKKSYFAWADSYFNIICGTADRRPMVRVHGFAMTSFELLRRYPWWSVDSASWTKAAGFGRIFVPRRTEGTNRFDFDRDPYCIAVSTDARTTAKDGHIHTLAINEKSVVKQWLKQIDVPLGKSSDEGEIIKYGVINSHPFRRIANLKFFEAMVNSLPEWPWPFKPDRVLRLMPYRKNHIVVVHTDEKGRKRKEIRRL